MTYIVCQEANKNICLIMNSQVYHKTFPYFALSSVIDIRLLFASQQAFVY